MLLDIDETRSPQLIFYLQDRIKAFPPDLRSLYRKLPCLIHFGSFKTTIIRVMDNPSFNLLNITPRHKMLKRLAVESIPVFYTAVESTHVDEVEWFLIQPIVCAVIDFELYIWWDEFWLDWTEISANYRGRWVEVAEVDGPFPRSSTNIEHALLGSVAVVYINGLFYLDIIGNWREK